MSPYGFKTTADDIAKDLAGSIKGKTILITGVSPGGLGAAFAEAIAIANPKLLILATRDVKKADETAAAVAAKASNGTVATKTLALDLSSQEAVRKAADEVNAWSDVQAIDVIVNNAGIMAAPYGPSADGLDMQFATNHIGHFLFTNLIMKKLLASGHPRVISVASDGCRLGGVRFDDYNFDGGKTFDTWRAYGQSKTANILFARSLAQKLGSKGLKAFSVHPGVIHTPLVRHFGDETFNDLTKMDRDLGCTAYWHGFDHLVKTPVQGAASYAAAAFDASLDVHNGAYLADCKPLDPRKVSPWARDDIGAEMLWELSEELVKQKFTY